MKTLIVKHNFKWYKVITDWPKCHLIINNNSNYYLGTKKICI